MPIPQSEDWRPEWGGALELYPVKIGADGTEEPLTVPSKVIPPSWNQFVFFEVQPGHSFHSVEEVVVDDGGCDRQRLSISGWFHKAQEGEEGYEGEETEKPKSSLEQLVRILPVMYNLKILAHRKRICFFLVDKHINSLHSLFGYRRTAGETTFWRRALSSSKAIR